MVDIESIIARVQPVLAELEPLRRSYRRGLKVFLLIFLLVIGGVLAGGFASGNIIPFAIGAGVLCVIGAFIYHFTVGKDGARYIASFKAEVIPKVLSLLDPDLRYDASRGIGSNLFTHSELFTTSADRYSTEDLISGKYGDTYLQLAEVHAEDRRTRTRDGKTETYYVTIFKGLLLIADFHKEFHGRTFVFPDKAESLFGRIGRSFQKLSGRRGTKLIQLEDPEFEKSFVVYSNDEIECRYILSTSMMRRIYDMRMRFGEDDIRIAFKDSSVIIAVPHSKSYLEPHTSVPATDPGQVHRMLGEMKTFLDIIEELNLNTRIWSKQ